MNKKNDPYHLVLNDNKEASKDFYDFTNEPLAVWLHDKPVYEVQNRWKMVIAFRNGHLKQLLMD